MLSGRLASRFIHPTLNLLRSPNPNSIPIPIHTSNYFSRTLAFNTVISAGNTQKRTLHSKMDTSVASPDPASMQDVAVSASPVTPAAESSPSPASPNTATQDMETVHFCTIYGVDGWTSVKQLEKRLSTHGIQFTRVEKKKGSRETEGKVFFENPEVMKEMMAKMSEIREEPSAPVPSSTPAAATATTAAATASSPPDAAAAAVDASAAAAPAVPNLAKLTKILFKVKNPQTQTRKRVRTEERKPRDAGPTEFRAAKRVKIELKEGEIGYAEAEAAAEEEALKNPDSDREDAEMHVSRSGRVSPSLQVEATINDVVAPLWRKPYSEQLVMKREGVKLLMQQATKNWKREYGQDLVFPHQTFEDVQNKKKPLFCPLNDIVPSPVLEAYRNKCEFSIGLNSQNQATIGHLMGKFTEGTVTVESVQDCPHVPSIAKSLAQVLTDFMRAPENLSKFKPYDKRDHSGFWRLCVVRNSNETRQCMMMIQVSAKEVKPEELVDLKARLLEHFKSNVINDPGWKTSNDSYELKSLTFQVYDGLSNAAPESVPTEQLYGDQPCIYEKLMGLDFRVSMNAFFQINVPQTNTLYTLAADFAKLPAIDAPQTIKNFHVLLDVCCGTGTIGLSLANRVGKVVGLEMSAAAVEDAKINAKLNNIHNAHYYVGKAEDTIGQALADHVANYHANSRTNSEQMVTAIVDPPRSGLHSDVVRLLRRNPRIDRIVYVSCNPKTLMENLQRFLQPASKKWTGAPFTAIRAIPVDMFPHCDHCEMVVLLERTRPGHPGSQQAARKPPATILATASSSATPAAAALAATVEPEAVASEPVKVEAEPAATQ